MNEFSQSMTNLSFRYGAPQSVSQREKERDRECVREREKVRERERERK